MDIEYYIADQVDKLEIPLNFRQRNFLEQLFMESYSKGNEMAHAVMDRAVFESQAMPFLAEAIDPFKANRDILERLSLGEWYDTVNVKNLLHNIRDRFFSRDASYTSKEKLLLHDLGSHEHRILERTAGLVEEGLLQALEEWCQNKVMNIAMKELEQEESLPDRKTKVNRPLVKKED